MTTRWIDPQAPQVPHVRGDAAPEDHPSATEPTADTPGAPAAGAPRWGAGAPAISLAAVALYVGVPCVWLAFVGVLVAGGLR